MPITLVSDSVYRGPRPQPSDYAAIKAQFKSVISLEGLAEDAKEADELIPVRVYSFPIVFAEIYFTGISQHRLRNVLGAIHAAPKPLLVHCEHGEDRTGLVIAAFRVLNCGYSKEAAMQEARKMGYRWYINLGLNKTWRQFEP